MRRSLFSGVDGHEVDDYLACDDPNGTHEVGVAVLVAVRGDGRLAGFAEIGARNYAEGCESTPVAYLESWYVDPDVRGSGVGRALVEAVADWARDRGFSELASDTEIDNDASQAAHRALGFEEVERQVCFRRRLR
jgi:aminoglycoside 6'-N-acetyltransferase I